MSKAIVDILERRARDQVNKHYGDAGMDFSSSFWLIQLYSAGNSSRSSINGVLTNLISKL